MMVEALLREAPKLLRIICFESAPECIANSQSHVISVNEASLLHNCFETFLNFNGSPLGVISVNP